MARTAPAADEQLAELSTVAHDRFEHMRALARQLVAIVAARGGEARLPAELGDKWIRDIAQKRGASVRKIDSTYLITARPESLLESRPNPDTSNPNT